MRIVVMSGSSVFTEAFAAVLEALQSPQVIKGAAIGEAEQPGATIVVATTGVETFGAPLQKDEGLLESVVGIRAIAEQAAADCVHAGAVAFDQSGPGLFAAEAGVAAGIMAKAGQEGGGAEHL